MFHLHVSLCTTLIAHGGKKKVSDSLGLSYRQLWAAIWVLAIEYVLRRESVLLTTEPLSNSSVNFLRQAISIVIFSNRITHVISTVEQNTYQIGFLTQLRL